MGDKENRDRTKVRMALLVSFVFLLILIPAVNSLLVKKDAALLYGVNNAYTMPEFGVPSFLNGSFQEQFEDAFAHGFSGYCLSMRTLNELRYRLFRQAGDKTVCKDGSLISTSYLEEYLGLSEKYVCSDEYLDQLVGQLEQLTALAKANNKQLIILVTPSKAGFIQDQIPDQYFQMNRLYSEEDRAIHRLITRMEGAGIPYIDSASLLHEKEWPFDLFPQTGIHWTREAALQALNAMLQRLEEMGAGPFKSISADSRITEDEPRRDSLNKDDDLWLLMNVFSKMGTQYTYPVETENNPASYDLPSVFMQGGSFSHPICELLESHDMARDVNLLFYDYKFFNYEEELNEIQSLYDPIIAQKVHGSDIIILEVNEEAVYNMGSGFYPVLMELLQQETVVEKQEFQINYRGFSPWETQNDVTWRWAYGKGGLLVFENAQPDDTLQVTFWVPYDGYVQQDAALDGPVQLEVYVNGRLYQQLSCDENYIFTVEIPVDSAMSEQDITVEIKSPYSFTGWTSAGAKEVSLQVLSAGRIA